MVSLPGRARWWWWARCRVFEVASQRLRALTRLSSRLEPYRLGRLPWRESARQHVLRDVICLAADWGFGSLSRWRALHPAPSSGAWRVSLIVPTPRKGWPEW